MTCCITAKPINGHYSRCAFFNDEGVNIGHIDLDETYLYTFNSIKLYNFEIYPTYRGLGLGKQSIALLCDILKNTRLELNVHKENYAARAIYCRAGFIIKPGVTIVRDFLTMIKLK